MGSESKHVKHFQQKHIKPEEQIIAFSDGLLTDEEFNQKKSEVLAEV